jgi:hypothetical protein
VGRKEDELWCVSCNESHSFNSNDPVVVILTDQNFSPMVPATDKKCCVVLRLEDCLLSELPGVLKEFFGNRTRYLPEGSLLIFGSLSHLVSRGPENYAEEAVKMAKVFSNMLDRSCSITHNVFLPLGGVESPGIIQDMYDVDCWLKSGSISSSFSLPATRDAVWRIFCEENGGDQNLIDHCERTLFMPESLKESKKIRTVAGNISQLPKKLKPVSADGERKIIHTLMHEIVDIYALNVELEPVLVRCSVGPASSRKNCGRIFATGASHVSRIVGGLVALDMEVINMSKPCWTASKDSIAKIETKLKAYGYNNTDTILMDLLSNNIFCGTDPDGNPKDSVKNTDGKWHIEGDLVFRPRSVIKKTLNLCADLFRNDKPHNLVVMSPVPRYVSGKCCKDDKHISNFDDPLNNTKMMTELDSVDDLLTGWGQNLTENAEIINIRSISDIPDASLSELTFQEQPLWSKEDPVHCIRPAYVARLVRDHVLTEELAEEGGSTPKRARLESVVVQREQVAGRGRPNRVVVASWSTGSLPASSRGSGRGYFRGNSGGRNG